MANVPAILGGARLGNFKLGYETTALARLRSTRVTILIAGVLANSRVWNAGLSIRDVINDAPNTAIFDVKTTAPTAGQDVRILVNSDSPRLLFNGTLQANDLTYLGKPLATQLVWPCSAIDDIARLNQRRPFGTWVNISVTTIAQSVIASYAPGFTSVHVQASLPTVSIVFDGTDDFSACLGRLATAIGGYFYVEDLDLHLFQTEATDAPDPIQVGYAFADDPPITATTDRSQQRTRQTGKGHGENVPVDVLAGETVIPVADAVMFSATGGKAIAGTTPDGAQSQILTYTGVQLGGAGSFAGPSATPGVAPLLTLAAGSGLSVGVYGYAYTWVTAAGETQPSPIAYVTTLAAVTNPTSAPTTYDYVNYGYFNAFTPIGEAQSFVYTYSTKVSFVDFSEQTLPSPPVAHTTVSNQDTLNPTRSAPVRVTVPYSTNPLVKSIFVYLKSAESGGVLYRACYSVANNPAGGTVSVDTAGTTGAAQAAPSSNTSAAAQQVAQSGISPGPSGTTSRKEYRTDVGGSQLKLQQTIANNTATTGVQDSTADGSLGVNAPTANTSGLATAAPAGGSFVTSASVGFSTNGAATVANTASPIFTSATYTFTAGDVGAYVYIKSGTNWTPRSYLIASVAGGAATLVGACASVASPTSATWGVDYSAFTTPRYTFTDLLIDAVTNTKFTSAAFPVGPNFIGNTLTVTGGVGFSVQQVVVMSFSGVIATCDKVLGTLGSTGAGTLGVAATAPYVFAGASTIQTSGAGPFSSTGGWVKTGADDLVRYTGISGNTLTGVPVSGAGALLTTIPYGSPLLPAPAISGVTGLALAMQKGTPVHIWVQRDDLAAQAALIALDAAQGRVSDGVVEGPPIVDERDGEALLTARCDATLALFANPIVTVTYATRDTKTKSGKSIVVNLTNPPISQTLVIQDVTITEIDVSPGVAPKFTVTASTVRQSLDAILRQLIAKK